MSKHLTIAAVTALLAAGSAGSAGPAGGLRPWSRDANALTVTADEQVRHDGRATTRATHTGRQDWCLNAREPLPVREGDVIELSAWLRARGAGRAEIAVITQDAAGKAISWSFGAASAPKEADGGVVRSRIIVPRGVAAVVPRLLGSGPGTVWMEGFTWKKAGTIRDMMDKDMPEAVTVAGNHLTVGFRTADAAFDVTDSRSGRVWRQASAGEALVLSCRKVPGGLDVRLLQAAGARELSVKLRLDDARPELVVSLAGEGELPSPLAYPGPFATGKGTYLVVPMNEGISYPVDDESIRPMRLVAYGGHGICMAFFGATDGRAGCMGILETPDDAAIDIRRADGLLCVAPLWEAQRGRFGYERRVRYAFFDRGGHVAMCKRYREHVKKSGTLKTLVEKRKEVPAVDLLVGAVNVWCWEPDAVGIVKEMQAAGIERILWSNRRSPEQLRALNELPGVLTSRYDIYQDVMDPANFKYLRGPHPDWTTAAWPKDLMLDEAGNWRPGWRVRCTDGQMRPCGVLCDRQAIGYAEGRVSAELKTHPYRCRFIDTTTASPWRECYAPNHPMTRADSRVWKMKLLGLMSDRFKLVTGSETGHDAAVPFVHYFEGMLSLGPYRVPDAGRDMARIWDEVPERVAKFQLGHRYRLPLWELVYHDCVVAQWYWGDYNNKLPALWDKRDLFNALYGTPPMFMFRRDGWREHKARFVQSYRATCPVARATGYSEMLDHSFLTPDRAVQQTRFANGTTVTVNFGEKPFSDIGLTLGPMGCHVSGLPQALPTTRTGL